LIVFRRKLCYKNPEIINFAVFFKNRAPPRPEGGRVLKKSTPPPSRDLKGVIRFCPGKWALGRSKGFGLVQFANDFIGWLLDQNVVLRVCDAQKLTQAKHEIEGMLERVRRAQSSS